MKRLHQVVLLASTVALSWFAMMAVHVAGHVLGAWISGGTVSKVVLHPLTISRADVSPNPQPLVVIWAGPVIGVLAPLLMWITTQLCGIPIWHLCRFFAGFCLIANGAYLGVGSFDHIGDAGDLMRHGADTWQLWLFGIICAPSGFLLWHRLGPHFGLGEAQGVVSIPSAYGCLIVLIAIGTLMAMFGGE
ncbi:MAG: hypothetical protein EXR98_14865 [Gemmataceae bacterium]|nr:hypothetical protein [Gemmataceae bacterium]